MLRLDAHAISIEPQSGLRAWEFVFSGNNMIFWDLRPKRPIG